MSKRTSRGGPSENKSRTNLRQQSFTIENCVADISKISRDDVRFKAKASKAIQRLLKNTNISLALELRQLTEKYQSLAQQHQTLIQTWEARAHNRKDAGVQVDDLCAAVPLTIVISDDEETPQNEKRTKKIKQETLDVENHLSSDADLEWLRRIPALPINDSNDPPHELPRPPTLIVCKNGVETIDLVFGLPMCPGKENLATIRSFEIWAYRPYRRLDWKRIKTVAVKESPTLVQITNDLRNGEKNCFSVRAVDEFGRCGSFSIVQGVFN